MAIRIRLTAVRDTTVDELRNAINAAMGSEPELLYGQSNGWSWCLASAWSMDGEVFEKLTADDPRIAIQITTSDGTRWYLTLSTSDKEPFRFCHPFIYLDSEEIED